MAAVSRGTATTLVLTEANTTRAQWVYYFLEAGNSAVLAIVKHLGLKTRRLTSVHITKAAPIPSSVLFHLLCVSM